MRKFFLLSGLAGLSCLLIGCTWKLTGNDQKGFSPCPKIIPEDMSCIPGGPFIRGSDSVIWKDENPAMKIVVSTFLIDKFEVSVEKFTLCYHSKKCTFAQSNYVHMRKKKFPQLKVSWFQAQVFCTAHEKRLPTEAEFEKASRGPNGEIYSWGNKTADCSLAVIKDAQGRKGCVGGFIHNTGTVDRIGSRPAGRYGLFDMTGNAHEWVSDWFHPDYIKCGKACNARDPKGPCDGKKICPGFKLKSVKGGSWYWNADWARAAKRRAWQPDNKPPHHFGFRCAKSVDTMP